MDFNIQIKTQLFPIFQRYGFEIVEEFKNVLRFQSSITKINIVHNPFENSNTIWVGKRGKTDMIEINNNLLILFFNSLLNLDKVSVEVFINNLVIFFENEGESLLIGNKINDLEKFDLERSKIYTQNLLNQQNINAADKAWQQNDYENFVNIINGLNYEKLPKPYLLKYKIAKQKLNR
ncbi:hypothetical protein [Chryseobacterium sp. SC28]|uniref:hypothetical protein n=1 Tax=Chryseobacterium sp. SC28 TaxID=2268028 RepID=UPI000F64B763|nr:hypothetical protein [Chryseobacterium sp. SC28]RRQ46497.1 hypothetical protein DTW91_04780 [Chryseobacterium sp. SC28]